MTTLADLLFGPDDPARDIEDRLRSDPATAPFVQGLLALTTASLQQVASAVAAYLQLPVADLLVSAWDRTRRIEAARTETRGRPGTTQHVAIGEHTVKSRRTLHVVVDLATGRAPLLDVDLSCELRLEAIVLEVADGRIVGCTPATAQGSVELSLIDPAGRERHRLVRREIPRVDLGSHTAPDVRRAA
jgi:hypothetical protein